MSSSGELLSLLESMGGDFMISSETEGFLAANQGAGSGRFDTDFGSTSYHEASLAIGEPCGVL